MFEQCFKNIDDILRKDAGTSNQLDYVEQTSWLLFLKYLEDLEESKKLEAELNNTTYIPILAEEYTWSTWAFPKTENGKLDNKKALTGDDLLNFINLKLFPYLRSFKKTSESADTLNYKIGEIFSEIKNKIQDGYSIREIINIIQTMKFQSSEEKHELSSLYEDRIKTMNNSGRNGGEYYTPRPLIKTIIKAINPKIGDTIYDGAVGSAGFLVEAFEYLKNSKKDLTVSDLETLQKHTLYGKEKKPLPYIIATMNMILHGIESPNILHTNTLAENILNIQEKDRFNIILANPPFGGKEKADIQTNFPIKSSETAYLFLQHFIKMLKREGQAGIIIKNTFLSNNDAKEVRRELLSSCNLYAILDLPTKVFTAGVKTVVLFFKKGTPSKKIWYYQLQLDRNLGKTNPLNEKDLEDFLNNFKTLKETENSWFIDINDLDPETLDLTVKNPNKKDTSNYRQPQEIINEIENLDQESLEILKSIKNII